MVGRLVVIGCIGLGSAPWVPDVIHVRGLAARVVVAFIAAIVASVYWTAALQHLATVWYIAGKSVAFGY